MRPSLALKLTKPHLLQPVLSGSNASPPWYLAGGIPAANCLRAYQPMLADDLADSYINLINPGTGDIIEVGAPVWDYANGWTGDGSSSSLRTGLTNTSAYKSVAIRFSNATGASLKALFGVATGLTFYAMPWNTYSGSKFTIGFGDEQQSEDQQAAGILIMTGQKAYFDGDDMGLSFAAFTPAAYEVYLLSMGARYYGNMSIQAVAFYDIDITPYVTPLYTALAAIGGIYQTINVAAEDVEDTLYNDVVACSDTGTFIKAGVLSRVMFSTKAQMMSLTLYSDGQAVWPTMSEVGVRVDGVDVGVETVSANGSTADHVVALPGGYGVSKTVEVINGIQGYSGGAIKGTWLKAAGFDKAATVYHPDASTDRILFIGDSIMEGGNAANPPLEAGVQLVRAAYSGQVLVEAWGSRALSSLVNPASYVALVATWAPTMIWINLGTNDYGLNQGSHVTYGTTYANLLDALHAELPDALIYCQTPTTRGTESANLAGSTMADFRAAVATVVSTRTAYCTLVDGTAMLTYPDDFEADTLHPTTGGQAIYGAAIIAELGIS